MKKLYIDTEMVTQMQQTTPTQEYFDQQFTQSESIEKTPEEDLDTNDKIEMIMQYAQLIIDNHVELRDIMLSILSKLTIIHTNDFGVQCFNTLKDLMVAEPELKEQVRKHIDASVIQKLNKLPPKDIPVGLLVGLKDLMLDPQLEGETKLTTPLFRDFFPKWLSEIKE